MIAGFPFPIAYSHHLIDTGRTPEARYACLLQCYEATVRYCATVQLSDYLAAGCPDPALNRKLLERLGRNFALGHWIELTREVTTLQQQGRFPAFIPEMVAFYFKPGKRPRLTDEANLFETTLCAARNDWAHPDRTWPPGTAERKFEEHHPSLVRLLEALDFLTRYPLYVPYQRPHEGLVSQALLLMGSTMPPLLKRDLNLELAPQLRDRIENETTAFLVAAQDRRRQLLLYPLTVFARRDDSEDLFLFDNCERGRQDVKWLLYRGFCLGQEPLEIVSGRDHNRLVEQFRALLQQLEGGKVVPPATAEPDDLSSHYFGAQREILRQHTRHFVGRKQVETALEQFLASQRRGYFLIRGVPGQGKTALACQLVKRLDLVHHFIDDRDGRADSRLILRSLLAQLLPRAGAGASLPETIPELTKRFQDALSLLAAGQKPLLVVIDGLDELPAQTGELPPFLVTDGLPEGVYVVVTSRPGDHFDRLLHELYAVEHQVHDLTALALDEIADILLERCPTLTAAQVERVAEACQGNPLYLLAAADELARNPGFDLRDLPRGIEGFFRRATEPLRHAGDSLGRDVLGLLTVARKPLTLRELGQATGQPQRLIYEQGIRPVRPFLFDEDNGYCFYHARFRDFVQREFLYEDELPQYHRQLARWLLQPLSRSHDYRWTSLAHHLFEAGNYAEQLDTINEAFLKEKVRRFGYGVLEDIDLLVRALLEVGHPALVQRCVDLVEGLRAEVGGDLIQDARRSVQGYRPGPASFRSRVVAPVVPTVAGLDVWVGMLPKVEVGADFFEVVPRGDRLVLVIGDAPGAGLKPAFVARFVGSLCRRLLTEDPRRGLGEVLGRLQELLGPHEYFQIVTLQLAEVDPGAGVVSIVNAGVPFPVLYSARRGQCDVLPIRGDLLQTGALAPASPPRWQPRRAEMGSGDVLVLVTDGLTEANRLSADAYRYRFTRLVEQGASGEAKSIGESILDDWRGYPREGDYADDVTVLVVRRTGGLA
jgi:hypothetical protein